MKKILSSLILFFCISFANAQLGEEPEFPTNQLFDLIEDLRTGIKNVVGKEKASRLDRNLSYLYYDLDKYLQTRKPLTEYLNENNYSNFDALKVEEDVIEMNWRLKKIGNRLNLIKDYLTDELNNEFDMLGNDMMNAKNGQWVFIDNLEKLCEGKKVDKAKLKKDGNIILMKLQKSLDSIVIIRKTLKEKYGL
jgi:hypothetical protein